MNRWRIKAATAGLAACAFATGALAQPNFQWQAVYDGPAGGEDVPVMAACDPEGNIVVIGKSMGATSFDWAIVKYDEHGNELWARRYDGVLGGDDLPRVIRIDADGSVYVLGSETGYRVALAKYSSHGDLQWIVRPGDLGLGGDSDLALAGDGGVYVATTFRESLDRSVELLKYDTDGAQLWHTTLYRCSGCDVATFPTIGGVHSDGSVYVIYTTHWPFGIEGINAARYDTHGGSMWKRAVEAREAYTTHPSVDASGNLFVVSSYTRMCFDALGSVRWKHEQDAGAPLATLLLGSSLYIGGAGYRPGGVEKFSLASGAYLGRSSFSCGAAALFRDVAGGLYAAGGPRDTECVSAIKLDQDCGAIWSINYVSGHGEKIPLGLVTGQDELLLLGHGAGSTPAERDFILVKFAAVCPADCDGDGELTFFDFLCFQSLFAAGDPGADCDGDGALTFFDFLCFQNAFAAGCP